MSIDNEQKKKALDAALLQIEKQYGKGAVMKLGDPSVQMNIETIPTGSLSLDIALGLGGIPKGRIIEIYGPESSGKTTVTLHWIRSMPRISASTSTTSIFPSLTAVSRLSRSRRPWSGPELSIS